MEVRIIKSEVVPATGDLSVNLKFVGGGPDFEKMLPEEILKQISVELGCDDWSKLLERIKLWKAS